MPVGPTPRSQGTWLLKVVAKESSFAGTIRTARDGNLVWLFRKRQREAGAPAANDHQRLVGTGASRYPRKRNYWLVKRLRGFLKTTKPAKNTKTRKRKEVHESASAVCSFSPLRVLRALRGFPKAYSYAHASKESSFRVRRGTVRRSARVSRPRRTREPFGRSEARNLAIPPATSRPGRAGECTDRPGGSWWP